MGMRDGGEGAVEDSREAMTGKKGRGVMVKRKRGGGDWGAAAGDEGDGGDGGGMARKHMGGRWRRSVKGKEGDGEEGKE